MTALMMSPPPPNLHDSRSSLWYRSTVCGADSTVTRLIWVLQSYWLERSWCRHSGVSPGYHGPAAARLSSLWLRAVTGCDSWYLAPPIVFLVPREYEEDQSRFWYTSEMDFDFFGIPPSLSNLLSIRRRRKFLFSDRREQTEFPQFFFNIFSIKKVCMIQFALHWI